MKTRWILTLALVLTAVPHLRADEDWGSEYYLFSRLDRAVNLTPKPGEELPEPPGISVGVPPAACPRVAMLIDCREDGTIQIEDTFRVRVKTSSDAFVQIYDVGTDGSLTELYPRSDQPQVVKRGQSLVLDGTKEEEWKVQGPTGREWVLAFATTAPVTVPKEMLTPTGSAEDAKRLLRLQQLKEQVKAICKERRIDVGFQERDIDVVQTSSASAPPGPPPPSTPPAPVAPRPPDGTPGPLPPGGPFNPPLPPQNPGAVSGKSTYPADRCYALCIGIDKYKNADGQNLRNLECAVNDATTMRDRFAKTMKVPESQIHLITDERATLAGLRQELEWLKSQAGPGKCLYLFWSGHGTQAEKPEGGSGSSISGLVPHDVELNAENPGLMTDGDIGKWIESVQAAGLVMVIDTCYSGAITKNVPKGNYRPRGFFMPRKPRASRAVTWDRGRPTPVNTARPNTLVIEAAQFDQQAWEDRDVHHGFLTQRLLEHWARGPKAPVLFQDLQKFVTEKAKQGGYDQVPNMVDNVKDPNFTPFGSN